MWLHQSLRAGDTLITWNARFPLMAPIAKGPLALGGWGGEDS